MSTHSHPAKFCSQCGTPTGGTDTFCGACGTKVVLDVEGRTKSAERTESLKTFVWPLFLSGGLGQLMARTKHRGFPFWLSLFGQVSVGVCLIINIGLILRGAMNYLAALTWESPITTTTFILIFVSLILNVPLGFDSRVPLENRSRLTWVGGLLVTLPLLFTMGLSRVWTVIHINAVDKLGAALEITSTNFRLDIPRQQSTFSHTVTVKAPRFDSDSLYFCFLLQDRGELVDWARTQGGRIFVDGSGNPIEMSNFLDTEKAPFEILIEGRKVRTGWLGSK